MTRHSASPGTTNGHRAEPAPEAALGILKVLVVDDQKTMRSILRRLLHEIGVNVVVEAQEGRQALDLLGRPEGQDVDLIITDLNMPGMDGLKFCNHVRRSETLRARHVPILVLTAEPDGLLIDVVRQVGAAEIVHKPISAPELRGCVERLVGIKGT
ncbi:MAG TPA: response regulator [Dongiaceae bacterium]|nr:response regulator [Dongiaceae bacterium]